MPGLIHDRPLGRAPNGRHRRAAEAIDTCPIASATHKPAQFSSRTTMLRSTVRAVEGQRSILINAARILAARTGSFRADVNETAGAGLVRATPSIRRVPWTLMRSQASGGPHCSTKAAQ
jgi:hypothetical protein